MLPEDGYGEAEKCRSAFMFKRQCNLVVKNMFILSRVLSRQFYGFNRFTTDVQE
jgi:hypothetical protein